MSAPSRKFSGRDFESLAEFRYQLRRFLRVSEEAARSEGLTPLQYQLLLQIAGYPGRRWAIVGELAERLQMVPHGVVSLLSRCEEAGLVMRRQGKVDRRQVEVHLTRKGAAAVARVAGLNWPELKALSSVFRVGRLSAFNDSE